MAHGPPILSPNPILPIGIARYFTPIAIELKNVFLFKTRFYLHHIPLTYFLSSTLLTFENLNSNLSQLTVNKFMQLAN